MDFLCGVFLETFNKSSFPSDKSLTAVSSRKNQSAKSSLGSKRNTWQGIDIEEESMLREIKREKPIVMCRL